MVFNDLALGDLGSAHTSHHTISMSSPQGSKEVQESQSPSLVAKTRDSQGLPFLPQKGVRRPKGLAAVSVHFQKVRPNSHTTRSKHKPNSQEQAADTPAAARRQGRTSLKTHPSELDPHLDAVLGLNRTSRESVLAKMDPAR